MHDSSYALASLEPHERRLQTAGHNVMGSMERRPQQLVPQNPVMSLGRLRGSTSTSQQPRYSADDVTDDETDQLHQLIDQQVVVY